MRGTTPTNVVGYGDFPGGPVVKDLPCSTGDSGSIPVWGTGILHAVGQLSPTCSNQREAPVPQGKIPHVTMKILCASTKTQCGQKYFFKGAVGVYGEEGMYLRNRCCFDPTVRERKEK